MSGLGEPGRIADDVRAAIRHRLLAARGRHGHWEGRLSSSALSTATAVTALGLRAREASDAADDALVRRGVEWLLAAQNPDGGWGDTDRSLSNISTTALGWAALVFGERTHRLGEAERAAAAWLTRAAGSLDRETLGRAIADRYGSDRTFSVPILTMCALAGRFGEGKAAWAAVPRLPFELAVIPRRAFSVVRLPVVSYALPALIAMGLVRHRAAPPGNPIPRAVRGLATPRALRVLTSIQPEGGGFLEATPLTSFVAMSLVGAGEANHRVARNALAFLRRSVRPDGSWPIDTNLATWVTTLAVQALAAGGHLGAYLSDEERRAIRDWLLGQQSRRVHPYTGAAPGAWAWTDLPGGVPDADDTPGALLALHALGVDLVTRQAAAAGVRWLLDLQNRDGGIPTFCRGWGALPFDRSGADLTAHAVRAWIAWRPHLQRSLTRRLDRGLRRALRYLAAAQRPDGSFVPLWFGNQWAAGDENPTYGTSRVLLALAAALPQAPNRSETLNRAVQWLLDARDVDGAWSGAAGGPASIEETALAVSALIAVAPVADAGSRAAAAARDGARWLAAHAGGEHVAASPIGFYFAKLWYYETLYPLIFTVDALERLAALRS